MADDLVSKRNAKAPIWQYFGFKPNANSQPENVNEEICKLCLTKVAASGGNTSNLYTHLQVHHKNEAAKMGPAAKNRPQKPDAQVQPSISDAFARRTKYKRDSVRWNKCTDAVTKYICKDMVSFYTVEKQFFKELINTLDSQYELPGRSYFSYTAIPRAYNRVRGELQQAISTVEHFSLTTDMWSSTKMTPYMSLTFHFIDTEWKLVSKCLQTSFLPEDHTAANLADALQEALHDWGLEDNKVSCITTDSGSNIKAAVRNLGWPWLSCFGHNLNLAVSNTIEKTEKARTDRALAVCRTINGMFSHSWRRKRELQKAQVELGLPEHSLVTVRLLLVKKKKNVNKVGYNKIIV